MTEKQPKTIPFSIRLTRAEREELERRAGKRPVGAFARERLFGHKETDGRRAKAKRTRFPTADKTALAQVLGLLGQSNLARNLDTIAEAARIGALPLTPDMLTRIDQACRDIAAMKSALMQSLGIKEE